MKRTQIQLPDRLYAGEIALAEQKEISLAELVRRGLEYMLSVSPVAHEGPCKWALPKAHALESGDPFADPEWRANLHMEKRRVPAQNRQRGVSGSFNAISS